MFHALKRLLSLLGLQTSPEKDCPPTTLMVLLGILIETVAMTLSILKEKSMSYYVNFGLYILLLRYHVDIFSQCLLSCLLSRHVFALAEFLCLVF